MTTAVSWTGGTTGVARQMYVPTSTWSILIAVALICSMATFPAYSGDSLWIGVAIGMAVLVIGQALIAGSQAPWIPGLVIITATIQWVLAPWAGYHMIAAYPLYRMAIPPDDYFRFAVPATLALAGGIYLPIMWFGLGRNAPGHTSTHGDVTATVSLRRTCDVMVVGGVIISAILLPLIPVNLRYAALLVGDLGCVGAFALCLMRAKGWIWRVAMVIAAQLVMASVDGVFHDLLLWLTYAAAIVVYRDRLRPRTLLVLIVAGVYMVATLNGIKADYRRQLLLVSTPTASDRVEMLASALGAPLLHPSDVFSDENVRYGVTRLNQGWILARILLRVPAAEPFAHGETIVTALKNAAIPRVLRPGKYIAGGDVYFERFTGIALYGVSMNLGLTGEMYANYGLSGGFLATFIWGTLVGLLFVGFAKGAERSPLWWAWAPYIMMYTAQAENGVGEVVNQVGKSIVVMVVMITLVPAWRELREWRVPAAFTRRLGRRPS